MGKENEATQKNALLDLDIPLGKENDATQKNALLDLDIPLGKENDATQEHVLQDLDILARIQSSKLMFITFMKTWLE